MTVRLVIDEDWSWENEEPIIMVCATKELAEKKFLEMAYRELESYWWEDTDKILASDKYDNNDTISYKRNSYLGIVERCQLYIEEYNVLES